MKQNAKPEIMSYQRWLDLNRDLWDKTEECTHCGGEGNFECHECMGTGQIECPTCDGEGEAQVAPRLYREAVQKDLDLWKRVYGQNEEEVKNGKVTQRCSCNSLLPGCPLHFV